MKILCVSLPLQDSTGAGARDNVPLASARAMAWAEASGALSRDEWAFLDGDAADHGGDAAVIAAAMASRPELMIFELQPWNLERSLWIARRLRSLLPSTHFAALGPEAVQGMPVFKAQAFDALIEGEPEAAVVELIADLASRSIKPRYAGSPALDLELLPDPYLSGALPVVPGKPVLIEASRGAVSYPAFLRPSPGPRFFARDAAPRVLRLASDRGVDVARFVDRRLDARPDFKAFVKSLAAVNEAGVALSGRLDPAGVDDEAASLLADAAFVSASAWLGSVNPKAQAAVGASLDKDGLERGAGVLWNQGIAVTPEVYLGLPGDDYDAAIETFDYLGMTGMGQDARLSPMPLSAGSAVRADTAAFGVKEYLESPPYWVIETDWMDEDDLLDAVADYEESFDVALGSPVAPTFKPERGGYACFADLRSGRGGADGLDALLVAPERLASSVTLLLDADDPERAARVARAARDLRRENPFCLWQIALASDSGLPPAGTVRRLADAFSMPEHYFELSRLFALDPQPDYQVRCFFVTGSEALALATLRERPDVETLFVLGDAMPGARLVESLPFLAFDREACPFELLYDVMSAYRDYPDLLVEAPRRLFGR